MKKIQVLMSTYNGEKYLREQIDSILEQDCERFGKADIKILVRDDGSKDTTLDILKEYADKYPDKIQYYQGENAGVIKSFFELIQKADDTADYYALADQDDYWMPGKISAGIDKIEEMRRNVTDKKFKTPLLYCCKPKLVDENLMELEVCVDRPAMRPDFRNALIENIVTGCTMVFEKDMRQMIIEQLPKYTTMHDRWFYLIATCFGKIYYDEESYICYRQHGGNVVGKNTNRLSEIKYRIKKVSADSTSSSRQAVEFKRVFGKEIEARCDNSSDKTRMKQNKIMLENFISGKKSFVTRLSLIKKGRIFRQRKNDNLIFKVMIALNMY